MSEACEPYKIFLNNTPRLTKTCEHFRSSSYETNRPWNIASSFRSFRWKEWCVRKYSPFDAMRSNQL